jgi:rhamnopyranosyl-N-acetylglucosaminyl-diphospho-decaprenol beta-1,3/1,4-galactofuranosyltransferase
MESVAGILVTFNRPTLVGHTVRSFLGQSHRLTALVVVDNASDSETFSTLQSLGVVPVDVPFVSGPMQTETMIDDVRIIYRRLPTNEGGAGGFHEGIKTGLEFGCDWMWLMDDDVEATPDTLEFMLTHRQESMCVHPAKRYVDGTFINWEGRFSEVSGRTIWSKTPCFPQGVPYMRVNYGCFEGMLIHKQIVQKIGLPDKRFFIVNDDLVYGWLASKHTVVLYLNHIGIIKHRSAENQIKFLWFTENEISAFTQYFNIRNHVLLIEYLSQSGRSKVILYLFFAAKLLKECLQALLRDRSSQSLKVICRGFVDGLLGRF